ncbi:MAG: reverse gyrase [Nitrososphaerota archaeon]|nr:reverse gyrase [Candidatus Calditenuaceae archaeon]MDW8073257.1 reverse gyrase [Nitrososphaerota archaeon]
MRSVYALLCPNCEGEITDWELVEWGVCRSCLISSGRERVIQIRPGNYIPFLELNRLYGEFEEFFKRIVGARPWSLQRTWAKRILLGRSFSMMSPTGTGKTTFCLAMALFQATRGKKSYIIVPTSLLVQHLLDRAESLAAKLQEDKPRIVGYYSGLKKVAAKQALKQIAERDYEILITTDRFLYGRFDLLRNTKFSFIFVDDVDSFLKSPRNIDKTLLLMGFAQEEVEGWLKLIAGGERESDETAPVAKRVDSVLVVSGATMKGRRTKRLKLFRLALNFEPGFSIELVRNIKNLYVRPRMDVWSEAAELIKRHGGGCLVFVPQVEGVASAKRLTECLNKLGIKAHAYERMNPRMLERFKAGEYDVLVGVASTRSPLARGIDLPERIRYVVFAGVPRREINVSWSEHRPSILLSILRSLAPIISERREAELVQVMGMLNKCLPTRSDILDAVKQALETGRPPDGFAGYVYSAVTRAHNLIKSSIGEEELRRIAELMDLRIRADENGLSILIPDIDGYVQASGRSSRMFAGGITRGISILIVEDEKAFRGIARGLEALYEETFQEYRSDLAEEEFKLCDRDRRLLQEMSVSEVRPEAVDILKSSLIIVESPTKARTLAYFFGRPSKREIDGLTIYESIGEGYVACLAASQGHVVDLTTSHGFHGVSIDNGEFKPVYIDIKRCLRCGEQFTDGEACPNCGSKNFYSKKAIIESLRKLAPEFDVVYIATDPDAEGEKIGYDIYVNVKPFNGNVKRLEFHEITRRALRDALKSPRDLSLPLVEAQTVRRIEDRWVGFELSRRLWEHFGRRHLSAGRVQTPVLGWVIQRMEEAKKRRTIASVALDDGSEIELVDPERLEEVKKLFSEKTLKVEVSEVELTETPLLPPRPYTTDSLLRDASLMLRMSTSEAMQIAQRLFESGLITYHRTGSTYVSSTGIGVARSYIDEHYPGLFIPRHHGEPGAHECIRPTRPLSRRQLELYLQSGMLRLPTRLENRDLALYDLIFRRFMASQMREAVGLRQSCKIKVLDSEYRVERIVDVKEPGFLKVFTTVKPSKPLAAGVHSVVKLEVRRVQAAYLFREGDVVALMRERGIGRPSTYARIISVLYRRGYIFNNKGRILATRLGRAVYEYLASNFGMLVSEELTVRLEELMEKIESGEVKYQDVLRELYNEALTISRLPEQT